MRSSLTLLMMMALTLTWVVPAQAASDPIPTLAYYYIWFDSTSWQRAKRDFPLLDNYSSDDRKVMRQHIQWAKAAGINGFIVSWKSTEVLNRRLRQLIELSEEEDFKLVIIYQGLDFEREPLPVERIVADLDHFVQSYASSPVFDLFARPVMIWSGTWKFSEDDIKRVTQNRRDRLLILATEHNRDGYLRLAELVDGNAYYWSSVNPETFPGYLEKLAGMGQAVHEYGGLWIAPAAPGFDARSVGRTSIVDRLEGETFREELNVAMRSSPDAVGIISWNEFSENTHIEPSQEYGSQYLKILSEIQHLPPPLIGEFDSSVPAAEYAEVLSGSRLIAIGSVAFIILAALILVAKRQYLKIT